MKAKIKAGKVTMSLEDYVDLMSTLKSAMDTEEANVWLRDARGRLMGKIASLENRLRCRPLPGYRVIGRDRVSQHDQLLPVVHVSDRSDYIELIVMQNGD